MSVRVKTQYLGRFLMPSSCVVCGNPPMPGAKWKVSGTKSEQKWSRTEYTTLNLEFPLCQECKAASRTSWPGRIVSWLGIPIAAVIVFVGLALWITQDVDKALICLAAFLGFGFSIVGARELGNLISQRGMTPEQRKRRKLVKKCAQIKRFGKSWRESKDHIVFEFENSDFAREFASMNLGSVV